MSNNFNMNFDVTTRQQFADVLADYGLTVPQAFKLFANQVIKTGVVPLSFDWRSNQILTPKAVARLHQTEQEFANGEFERFESLDELNQAMADIARG